MHTCRVRRPFIVDFAFCGLRTMGQVNSRRRARSREPRSLLANTRAFTIEPEAGTFPAAFRDIHWEGGLVFFEIGPG